MRGIRWDEFPGNSLRSSKFVYLGAIFHNEVIGSLEI